MESEVRRAARRVRDDGEVERAARRFCEAARRPWPLERKLLQVTALFQDAAAPYNLRGDDRVLSRLRIEASSVVEEIFRGEIRAIQEAPGLPAPRMRERLRALRRQVEGVSWLPEGFQSSLQVDIAFAEADVSLGGRRKT